MQIEKGKIYKHFKGKYVLVLGLAKYYKDEEIDVIYKGLNSNEIFVRAVNSFLEKVKFENGEVSRFTLVEDEEVETLISKQKLQELRTFLNLI